MRIIKPSVKIEFPTDMATATQMLELVERAARLCYKSEGKMGPTYSENFLRSKIDAGHLSVTEHSLISMRVICDRGVSHEIVRHRLASYSQESTRYCNYSKEQFGGEITVIEPCFWKRDSEQYTAWRLAISELEDIYFMLLNGGATPQEARAVLPNSLKTELIFSMNFRELRHFLKLRLDKAAHPQMREVAALILKEVKALFPIIFDDFEVAE
jgi:thymidylate synthase (FAD)